MQPLDEQGKISSELKNRIFSNSEHVLAVNTDLLVELQTRINSSDLGTICIGDIFFKRVRNSSSFSPPSPPPPPHLTTNVILIIGAKFDGHLHGVFPKLRCGLTHHRSAHHRYARILGILRETKSYASREISTRDRWGGQL